MLLVIAALFALAGLAWLLLWLFVFSLRQTTDNAYVGGNQVGVNARVGGTVTAIYADDTDLVRAGQVLVRLDGTDTRLALQRAAAALAQAVRQARQADSGAAAAGAAEAQAKIALAQAEADYRRRLPLLAEKAVPPEEVAHAREAVERARAALAQASGQARAQRALVEGVAIAQNPAVQLARAAYVEAWVADHRTAIVAPVDGIVAGRNVQVGQLVAPGQPLLKILPLDQLWVDANFKEGQLDKIRLGQPARLTSDLYGSGVVFHGKVAGIAAGAGSVFSLLPAQNASGNWIKVVQRVPVRIALERDDTLRQHPLRLGLSMEVEIDTRDQSGPRLPSQPPTAAVGQTDVYAHDLDAAAREADAIIAANGGR
ncbi:HlyD family secretion protein [Thermomonas haemolytica]|nr:HlyD family secretion protein [Thermomonas haemolytica]